MIHIFPIRIVGIHGLGHQVETTCSQPAHLVDPIQGLGVDGGDVAVAHVLRGVMDLPPSILDEWVTVESDLHPDIGAGLLCSPSSWAPIH